MKERPIKLSDGSIAIVDSRNYSVVSKYTWNKHSFGYAQTTYNGRCFTMHRLIAGFPTGMHVHHKNGDPLDNRRSNLSVVTPKQHVKFREKYNGGKNPFWGKSHTKQSRELISKRFSKQVAMFSKDWEYITCFRSILSAEYYTGINNGNISLVCTGKRKTAGGYVWRHV